MSVSRHGNTHQLASVICVCSFNKIEGLFSYLWLSNRAPEWRMHIAFPSHSASELYWGRPLTFLQKLSRFNFSSKHQSFTIFTFLIASSATPSWFCRAGSLSVYLRLSTPSIVVLCITLLLRREVMTTPAIIFQELYIKILLKLFKEVLLSTTVDPLLMSWWKPTQEQPLNLPKTMFAMLCFR